MKRNNLLLLAFAVSVTFVAVQSCKKDADETPKEVIADNSTFANFTSWSLDATTKGPSPNLGPAHAGNDSTVTRKIYFKDGQKPVNGVYPLGTVIVKHSTNPAGTVNDRVAMVKRGNGFNPNAGDWEWFVLATNGEIAKDANGNTLRGGVSLLGGACNSCHSIAKNKDFVFTK
jgi:hypothetical protein